MKGFEDRLGIILARRFAASLPPQPDLQVLAERYGGFAKVPVEAWRAFEKRMAKYKDALRRENRLTKLSKG
jgi:hypothetical protein